MSALTCLFFRAIEFLCALYCSICCVIFPGWLSSFELAVCFSSITCSAPIVWNTFFLTVAVGIVVFWGGEEARIADDFELLISFSDGLCTCISVLLCVCCFSIIYCRYTMLSLSTMMVCCVFWCGPPADGTVSVLDFCCTDGVVILFGFCNFLSTFLESFCFEPSEIALARFRNRLVRVFSGTRVAFRLPDGFLL